MTERVARTLVEDDPEYGWWDHEASAVDEHYNEQDSDRRVAGDLGANAEWLAGTLALVEGAEWDRRAPAGARSPSRWRAWPASRCTSWSTTASDAEARLG